MQRIDDREAVVRLARVILGQGERTAKEESGGARFCCSRCAIGTTREEFAADARASYGEGRCADGVILILGRRSL